MKKTRKLLVLFTILIMSGVFISCNEKEGVNEEFVPKTTTTDYLNVLNYITRQIQLM